MSKHAGSIVVGASLATEDAVCKALATANAIPNRTTWLHYENKTSYWNARLVLMQGINEYYEVPSGYQRDTGVTVSGVNVTGGSAQTTAIQECINVTVTRGKCSAQLIGAHGEEQTFTHPDIVCEQGRHWVTLAFGIQPSEANDVAFAELVDDEGRSIRYQQLLERNESAEARK